MKMGKEYLKMMNRESIGGRKQPSKEITWLNVNWLFVTKKGEVFP